jgi:hypothetical protein
MTVNSSIVCGRAHPYIMSPKMSSKPCWRRIAFLDPAKWWRSWRVRAHPGESAPAGVSHRSALRCGFADRVNEAVQAAMGRQHRVRTTPVPANAAQAHQDDDKPGDGRGGRWSSQGGVREHSRLEEDARGG